MTIQKLKEEIAAQEKLVIRLSVDDDLQLQAKKAHEKLERLRYKLHMLEVKNDNSN